MEPRESLSQPSTPSIIASRDSSSIVTGSLSGIGSVVANDTAPSMAAALAKDASLHFQTGRFDECLNVLHQLASKKEDDPRILNNIAIDEFFRDGCSNPRKLLEVLNRVKKKNDELAAKPHDLLENTGSKSIQGAKGSGMTTMPSSNEASLDYLDEYDSAVASLNIAIVWHHLHDYSKALSVLLPLYQKIDPIDESTALHVCLLLLDVALACKEAAKSVEVLNYLEKPSGGGCSSQVDSGSIMPANSATNPFPVVTNASASDATTELSNTGISLENSFTRSLSLSDDVLEYDESMFSLDMSGQPLSRPAGFAACGRKAVNKSLLAVDLKLKLQLYKVQFLLLTRNFKQAKREVKLAMNIARGRDSSTALLLKSQLEYARGNHSKAIKLLSASSNRSEDGSGIMMNNNLGCIHFRLGKYNLASVYFLKSLRICSSLRKEKSWKLMTEDKSFFIFYNSGMQHLVCGKPLLAARYFQKAAIVFDNRPILWLRLTECCLMASEKGLLKNDRNSSELSDILVTVIGSGKYRYLAIDDENTDPKPNGASQEDGSKLKLSLSMARHCLRNSLFLLGICERRQAGDEHSDNSSTKNSNQKSISGLDSKTSNVTTTQLYSNGESKEPKGSSHLEIMQNSVICYEEAKSKERHIIKQAVLADMAFVELELGNPLKAFNRAKSLLELQECSPIYRYFGHIYAAEALCLLKHHEKAAELLSAYLTNANDVSLPFTDEDCEEWCNVAPIDSEESGGGVDSEKEEHKALALQKPEESRGTLYANFAFVNVMQGDLEVADQYVMRAMALLPDNRNVILTAVYIDLASGQSQAAISKLKSCKRATFLRWDV